MIPLKITAHLLEPIAVYDNWSPSLDALLEWLWLEEHGLASTNPAPEELVQAPIPLEKGELQGEWYWKVSSPQYTYTADKTDAFRKRWEPVSDGRIDWGKRKAKWDTSQGAEKSYDLPLYLRNPQRIEWYAVGQPEQVAALLEGCTGLGKKRSYGCGKVEAWEVVEAEKDLHLWNGSALMRPVPARLLQGEKLPPMDIHLLKWGWRPPARMPHNQDICVMPAGNVRKI